MIVLRPFRLIRRIVIGLAIFSLFVLLSAKESELYQGAAVFFLLASLMICIAIYCGRHEAKSTTAITHPVVPAPLSTVSNSTLPKVSERRDYAESAREQKAKERMKSYLDRKYWHDNACDRNKQNDSRACALYFHSQYSAQYSDSVYINGFEGRYKIISCDHVRIWDWTGKPTDYQIIPGDHKMDLINVQNGEVKQYYRA